VSSGNASTICSGGPLGCWIRGHIEMNDLPAIVKKDDEAVQNAEIDRRDREKIYGRNLIRMIGLLTSLFIFCNTTTIYLPCDKYIPEWRLKRIASV
jgi:hypothetical protein